MIWINGEMLADRQAAIAAVDRGWLYGDGIFETLRCCNGRPLLLQEHLDRLYSSAEQLRIRLTVSRIGFGQAIADLQGADGFTDAYVRITVSRGVGGLPGDLETAPAATVAIQVRPFAGYPRALYGRGMRAIVSPVRRNETSPLSNLKTLNQLDNLLARAAASRAGAEEALMLNSRGEVAEGSMANLFVVVPGKILTPPLSCGILPGITRAVVMRITEVTEEALPLRKVLESDEAFLTNSLMEIMPLVKVGRESIGGGAPGPVTRELRRKYAGIIHRSGVPPAAASPQRRGTDPRPRTTS